jgi:hypothetical protein
LCVCCPSLQCAVRFRPIRASAFFATFFPSFSFALLLFSTAGPAPTHPREGMYTFVSTVLPRAFDMIVLVRTAAPSHPSTPPIPPPPQDIDEASHLLQPTMTQSSTTTPTATAYDSNKLICPRHRHQRPPNHGQTITLPPPSSLYVPTGSTRPETNHSQTGDTPRPLPLVSPPGDFRHCSGSEDGLGITDPV